MLRPAIDDEALRRALGARWKRVTVVDEAASTNAALLADHGAPDPCVLVAEHQHAGRGRLERVWESPPRAGLTCSVLLRPQVPIAMWGWLPLLAGVAVQSALRDVAGVDAVLKWPNDVLCGPSRHKVGGLLVQTGGKGVVVGIGLNVTTSADELPVDTATSLALCGARELDRTALLVGVLTRLDSRVAQWSDARGDAQACGLAADYRGACATIGTQVVVHSTDGTTASGTAVAVENDGRLRVVTAGGAEQVVGAGDVEHLRPA
ncbi:MAG: biotin--[acetyl-CoA-carboxylase] ligase [Jatrophihabitantaceae bacterium]